MFSPIISWNIVKEIRYIDMLCRSDLSMGLLASERDYVSRLITHITYPQGPWYSRSARCITFTSPGGLEQKFGVDGIIIFKKGSYVKVGMFEAKWPRTTFPSNRRKPWDTPRSAKTKTVVYSRFSNQLRKQRKWTNQVAIWEMFFYEGKNNSSKNFYNPNGATCIWHDEMYSYFKTNQLSFRRRTWNQTDLDNVFSNGRRRSYGWNIRDIIFPILRCKKGKPILLNSNGNFTITSNDGSESEDVPTPNLIPNSGTDAYSNSPIQLFMKDNGLNYYIFFDMDQPS